jgi:hypothetical protein
VLRYLAPKASVETSRLKTAAALAAVRVSNTQPRVTETKLTDVLRMSDILQLTKKSQEQQVRVAEVVRLSNYVWDSSEPSSQFLLTPHPALGGEMPLRAAMTTQGAAKVRQILGAILHGLPA